MTQKGFTLVELAIALMVIGLLIGGVLKGQELIENAKITSFIRQIKAYDAATLIFRNTYGALPGDIKRPNRIPNCTVKVCDQGGNGNGKILYSDTPTTKLGLEQYNFFPHLTKAGMIQGPEGGDDTQMDKAIADYSSPEADLFRPLSPFNTIYFFVDYRNDINLRQAGNYYLLDPLSGKVSLSIDNKLDDGNPQQGDIRPIVPERCLIRDDPDEDYDITLEPGCVLSIITGF